MHRKILAISFAVIACALPALAQNPNLGGTWKLNLSKSDFGQIPPPASETQTIVVSGSSIKITTDEKGGMAGDSTNVMNLTTDGKETTWSASGNPVKSTAQWQGKALVVNSSTSFQGSDVQIMGTYTVSDDGKTLNIAGHYVTGMGIFDIKAVFDQAGAMAMADPPAAAKPAAMAMAHSGPTPNFSGTWKLALAKSDFGQIPAPASQVDTIEHSEPSVKIAVDQKGGMMGDTSYSMAVTTDGKESTGTGMSGDPVKSVAHWDGAALVVDSKTSFQGQEIKIKDNFSLSADGKTLTEVTHIESGMGNFDTTSVYDKQ